MKLLSIVIPAYNASKYLSKCLDSFICEDYIDKLDVLIVDDGSSDNTVLIAKEYAERYPDVIRVISKENGNVGSVYNIAFKKCLGKYVRELDADDYLDSRGLKMLLNELENCSADIVFNHYETVNENGVVTSSVKCVKDSFDRYGVVLSIDDSNDLILSMHSMVIRNDVLNRVNELYDEKCFYVDMEYVLFCLPYCNNYIVYDFSVYRYLLGTLEQSVNIDNFINNIDMHYKVFRHCLGYYDKYLNNNKLAYRQLFSMLCTHFRVCLSIDDRNESINELKKIINLLKKSYNDFYLSSKKENRKISKFVYMLDDSNYLLHGLRGVLLK